MGMLRSAIWDNRELVEHVLQMDNDCGSATHIFTSLKVDWKRMQIENRCFHLVSFFFLVIYSEHKTERRSSIRSP